MTAGPWFYEGDHFVSADLEEIAMDDRDALRLIAMRWRGVASMLREPERARFAAQLAALAASLETAHDSLATLIDDAYAYREARNREADARRAACGDCDGNGCNNCERGTADT